ncbi:YggS family pyridoxal phosphate-dependent enzyme [Amphibacillus sp. MSJ-3]|uniref:YggS family pyridoxal phosphate-dependent enzyme n=1 Tax=Amphibacillus sp. MSJ-3 TaxID=2841505 RepID=UPI001C0ED825|nr:YggS family pyridoxal phosphate-dependent enzyme [Amphibacillus sp. MSJ-3]
MTIESNIEKVKQEIKESCQKVGRSTDEITLIAVTKYVTIEQTKEVIDAKIVNIAENRLEGLTKKQAACTNEDVIWHFIGNLQSRKVKDIVDKMDYFHALDRLSIAKEINKRAKRRIPCFVQVNVSGEKTKNGIAPNEVESFIESLADFPNVEVVGLMTMAPYTDDQIILRQVFRKLRELRDYIVGKNYPHAPCQGLSMGMSHDYKIAIEEGATHIRIGNRIVGTEG